MYIITMPDQFAYWTDKIEEKDGFLIFETVWKDGTVVKHNLKKSLVAEIAEQEGSLKEFRAKKKSELEHEPEN